MTPFTSQITFLDFEDFAAGKEFFSQVLQLEPVYDIGWATVYGIAGKAFLGIVDRRQKCVPHRDGLLISLTTDCIDSWHAHVRSYLEVSPIAEVPGAGLKSFFFTGPEGYRFEIQQFTEGLPKGIFY